MADTGISEDQEQQVKKLKRFLEGWRGALLALKPVFLWEQQWHPCAIVGTVSFLFLVIWLLDLNALTMFAVIGLFVNFVDFVVPIIYNSICGPNSWNGQKEKVFEDVCKSIVRSYNSVLQHISSFYSMRETSPCMYYLIAISMMLVIAWISSAINNVFLLYVLSIVTLLWPGIRRRGLYNALLSMVNIKPKALKKE